MSDKKNGTLWKFVGSATVLLTLVATAFSVGLRPAMKGEVDEVAADVVGVETKVGKARVEAKENLKEVTTRIEGRFDRVEKRQQETNDKLVEILLELKK